MQRLLCAVALVALVVGETGRVVQETTPDLTETAKDGVAQAATTMQAAPAEAAAEPAPPRPTLEVENRTAAMEAGMQPEIPLKIESEQNASASSAHSGVSKRQCSVLYWFGRSVSARCLVDPIPHFSRSLVQMHSFFSIF